MDDNKTLLMMILKLHFKGRYSVVEEALAEINGYCKTANKITYKEVSRPKRDLLRFKTSKI